MSVAFSASESWGGAEMRQSRYNREKLKNGCASKPHERNETSLYLFCSLSHLSQLYPNQRHTKTLRNRIYKPSHK